MSAEEIVKQKWPDAQPMHFFWVKPEPFWEIANGEYIVGRGDTEAEAWADAAQRLAAPSKPRQEEADAN